MAWVTIPNTDIDADSAIDVALMTAMRDNPIAIANGDAGAPVVRGKFLKLTKITASGTHVLDSECRTSIALLAGGGGGGSSASSGYGTGGQAGAQIRSTVARAGGESLTVAIGAGGSGASAGGAGGAGGTTTLTGHTSAAGGLGGAKGSANNFSQGLNGESGIGIGGLGSSLNGSPAAANSAAGGAGSASLSTAGAGGSGVVYIWEFA